MDTSGARARDWFVLSMYAWHAGMYKAMTVRSNPRLRTVNSVLRTYITVLHVKHQQKDVLFSSTAAKSHGARAASEVPATPGTPGSMAGSEVGSQVPLPLCVRVVKLCTAFLLLQHLVSTAFALAPW